jgi:hypothetical protein
MARYAFRPSERWAVFETHGSKCWLCDEPVNFVEMEVDHILPESLLKDRSALDKALAAFGLQSDFDLNSFENWLPAHRRCNGIKREHIFRPTPIIQVWIDRARDKAGTAREACDTAATQRQIGRAIGILSAGPNRLPDYLVDAVAQHYASANSVPQIVIIETTADKSKLGYIDAISTQYVPPKEVRLGPNLVVIFDDEPKPSPTGPFTYKIDSNDNQ